MLKELEQIHPLLADGALVLALLVVAYLSFWLTNRSLVLAVRAHAQRSAHLWDDALIRYRVAWRLSQLVPVFIIYTGFNLLPGIDDSLKQQILNLTGAYMIGVVTLTITAALSAANDIYDAQPSARQRPIKGFVQLLQLLVIIIGFLLIVATLMQRSPLLLLSGFGALTAVLLLIFKDTILSLVASVQLSALDMVRVGDWIEVPQFGADGDVIDVELHTVRVQNWDKTITTIPTHRLISDSFKNWRGMSLAGGRRIKRALYLDAGSIRFLQDEEIERYKGFALLADYIVSKQSELEAYNHALERDLPANAVPNVNLRRMTNLGTFRAYAYNYLKYHPSLHKDMTLMVRQLMPGPEGLPIELYCFTTTTAWSEYEGIQADIFDHLLAIIPEFGLRLYQLPAGADLAGICAR